jgi:hypothetical protein
MKKMLAITTVILGMGILFVNIASHTFGWYGLYSDFDRVMHFLGGAFVFCFLLLFLRPRLKRSYPTIAYIGLVLIIGALWEVYEYLVQHYIGVILATVSDSIDDLVFDVLGAIAVSIVFYFVYSAKKRYNTPNAGQ